MLLAVVLYLMKKIEMLIVFNENGRIFRILTQFLLRIVPRINLSWFASLQRRFNAKPPWFSEHDLRKSERIFFLLERNQRISIIYIRYYWRQRHKCSKSSFSLLTGTSRYFYLSLPSESNFDFRKNN